MIGRTLSHYKVLEEISRGGMGIVYKAIDLKLNREVAVKVLPPELVSDPSRRRRLVQEAQAAAALKHPNIAVIHEVDEVDDVDFIAMELIEGESLRDVVSRGPISAEGPALKIATEIAEALAAAHDKGIVHRDLKPGNVLITEEGRVKVIDFGLAKLVDADRPLDSDLQTAARAHTEAGVIVGTVSYMSPEQAGGRPVDHRSDIFSFGALLYEMLTARIPFLGETSVETLHEILKGPTPQLASLGSEVLTADLQRIINKCLAKDPDHRYQSMTEVIVDLRAVGRSESSGAATGPILARPGPSSPSRWRAAVAAIALVLLGSLLLFRSDEQSAPTPDPAASGVAILLFDNLSGDASLEWLRTGLMDMLVTDLARLTDLDVVSTDRILRILKEEDALEEIATSEDIVRRIADKAESGTVVLGSFMKAGEVMRVNLRVQDVASGEIRTTASVEGEGDAAIFTMVDELSQHVRSSLSLKLPSTAAFELGFADYSTSSLEAYRYYVEGHRLLRQSKSAEALVLYKKASEEDPEWAPALQQVSMSYSNLGHEKEYLEYAERAFKLSERLHPKERYAIEGWYYAGREETYWESIQALRKHIELRNEVATNHLVARRLFLLERVDEAIEQWETLAAAQSPLWMSYDQLAGAYAHQERFGDAAALIEGFINTFPDRPEAYAGLGEHWVRAGRLDAAVDAFEKAASLDPHRPLTNLGRFRLEILRERWKDAEDVLTHLVSARRPISKWQAFRRLALLALYRGDSAEAVVLLDQAVSAYETPATRSASARTQAAAVHLARDEAAQVLQLVRAAQKEARGNSPEWEGLFYEAMALAELGEIESASQTADKLRSRTEAMPTDKETRRLHHLRGELALARDEPHVAVGEIEQAESMLLARGFEVGGRDASPHVPIWFSLARAYMAVGDEDKAIETLKRVTESSNEHIWWPIPYVRSFYLLGELHERRGEMVEARENYGRFVEYWSSGDIDRGRVSNAMRQLDELQ